ncbi:hypothetical protein Golax_025818, partial [Gossypium laxum]|nr:hypothetical protein [Gossypium laxum]
MELFRETLDICQLSDVGYTGRWFTWERGNLPETNIQERLDRGVANASWISMFPEVRVEHLVHSFSDHCPIFVNTNKEDKWERTNQFKFEAWWIMEDSFVDEAKRLWEIASGDFLQKMEMFRKGLVKKMKQVQRKKQ